MFFSVGSLSPPVSQSSWWPIGRSREWNHNTFLRHIKNSIKSYFALLLFSSMFYLGPPLLVPFHQCFYRSPEERGRGNIDEYTCWTRAQTDPSLFTSSLWYGNVSPVKGRSLLMSWPMVLKVGLWVGSKLQQSFIRWYLRGQMHASMISVTTFQIFCVEPEP